MASSPEELHPIIVPDGTISLLHKLVEDPLADVRCSLSSGDPAVMVFRTPKGCVARPMDRIQALCMQHIETDGLIEGGDPIVDLTVGEKLSERTGITTPLRLGYTAVELQNYLDSIPRD